MAVVLGAGTWGMALVKVLYDNKHPLTVWSHSEKEIEYVKNNHHIKNLPFLEIPDAIKFELDMGKAMKGQDLVVIAVSSPYVREVSELMASRIEDDAIITIVAKGIEIDNLLFMSEVVEDVLRKHGKKNEVVALSGPTHAEEVSRGIPTTIVSASKNIEAAKKIQNYFMNENFRVYTNDDINGVEFCGAFKNIYALICGISTGLGFGDNSKAAILTRGLAEMIRLGEKIGYKRDTFYGLAGIGDLIVTGMSIHSRNNKCGRLIGEGHSVSDAIEETGMVVEGINCLPAAMKLKNKYQVDMPLLETLYGIIFENKSPKDAIWSLMMRDKKSE